MRGACVAYGLPSVVVEVYLVVNDLNLCRRPRRRRLSHVIAVAPRITAIRPAMRMVKPNNIQFSTVTFLCEMQIRWKSAEAVAEGLYWHRLARF